MFQDNINLLESEDYDKFLGGLSHLQEINTFAKKIIEDTIFLILIHLSSIRLLMN